MRSSECYHRITIFFEGLYDLPPGLWGNSPVLSNRQSGQVEVKEGERWCECRSTEASQSSAHYQILKRSTLGFPGGAVVGSPPAGAGGAGSGPGLGGSRVPRSGWAREPQLLGLRVWSLCSAAGGPAVVRGPRTAMKGGPRLPQLEKALAQKQRPNTAINK